MTLTEDLFIDGVNDLLSSKIYSGEFIARKFWEMDCSKQADFFNTLANISKDSFDSHMQWRYMQEGLTKEGKSLLDNMKIHTD